MRPFMAAAGGALCWCSITCPRRHSSIAMKEVPFELAAVALGGLLFIFALVSAVRRAVRVRRFRVNHYRVTDRPRRQGCRASPVWRCSIDVNAPHKARRGNRRCRPRRALHSSRGCDPPVTPDPATSSPDSCATVPAPEPPCTLPEINHPPLPKTHHES